MQCVTVGCVLLSSAVCYVGLCCWAVQYVVTAECVLLSSAACCYGGLCVVGQCSMFLRWTVFYWAVQYVATVVCVVEQCSMLLRWAVCC